MEHRPLAHCQLVLQGPPIDTVPPCARQAAGAVLPPRNAVQLCAAIAFPHCSASEAVRPVWGAVSSSLHEATLYDLQAATSANPRSARAPGSHASSRSHSAPKAAQPDPAPLSGLFELEPPHAVATNPMKPMNANRLFRITRMATIVCHRRWPSKKLRKPGPPRGCPTEGRGLLDRCGLREAPHFAGFGDSRPVQRTVSLCSRPDISALR